MPPGRKTYCRSGLEVERALEQSQAVSQLDHRFGDYTHIRIQLLRSPLKILQVIAKMTVHNAQADYVDWTEGRCYQ